MSYNAAHKIIADIIYEQHPGSTLKKAEGTASLILSVFTENGILVLTARELSNIIAQAVLDGEG